MFNFEGLRKKELKGEGSGTLKDGGIAQLGEHLLCKQGVIGSNPFISTKAEAGKAEAKQGARGETPPNQEMGL